MEGPVASQLLESIFKRLTDAVQARDRSFYHIRLLSSVLSKSLLHARRVANEIVLNVSSDEQERTAAGNTLYNAEFVGMGVTTHSCSCAQFYNYNPCKHVVRATMKTTGQLPPPNVDPRPLASRRRAGRPRATDRALDILPDAQNPLL
jgi:SWIM zinc finger